MTLLDDYAKFTYKMASECSSDLEAFVHRCSEMHSANLNIPLLLTSAIGLGGESGEFQDVVKKLIFHDKPISEELIRHIKQELGDILWYWTNACNALNLSPTEVIAENISKLKARHPTGVFGALYSK